MSRSLIADHDEYPQIADLTADFVYARLQRTREEEAARLSAARARPLGEGGAGLGARARARPASLCQRRAGGNEAARCLRLRHQRRQGPQPAGGQALIERLG